MSDRSAIRSQAPPQETIQETRGGDQEHFGHISTPTPNVGVLVHFGRRCLNHFRSESFLFEVVQTPVRCLIDPRGLSHFLARPSLPAARQHLDLAVALLKQRLREKKRRSPVREEALRAGYAAARPPGMRGRACVKPRCCAVARHSARRSSAASQHSCSPCAHVRARKHREPQTAF